MVTQVELYKRLDWIDIAKSLAIILMVAGHTSIPELLSKWIWSFHMPLFFIVSGMLYNEQKYTDFTSIWIARTYSILLPYMFFSIVVCAGYQGTVYYNPIELLRGWDGYALWFMPVLFFSELIFNRLVSWSQNNRPIILTTVLLFSILGWWLSSRNYHIAFKMEVIPFAIFFYGFGYCFKDRLKTCRTTLAMTFLMLMLNFAVSQLLPKLDMCINQFGQYPLNLLNALLGTIGIFSISKLIDKKNCLYMKQLLIWCGQNTLLFMALSQLLNYWLLIAIHYLHISKVIALPLRYFLLFGLIYAIGRFFNKYCPALIGKYSDVNK